MYWLCSPRGRSAQQPRPQCTALWTFCRNRGWFTESLPSTLLLAAAARILPTQAYFLICEKCRTTREMAQELDCQGSLQHLQNLADSTGFKSNGALIEMTGLCPACQGEADV